MTIDELSHHKITVYQPLLDKQDTSRINSTLKVIKVLYCNDQEQLQDGQIGKYAQILVGDHTGQVVVHLGGEGNYVT